MNYEIANAVEAFGHLQMLQGEGTIYGWKWAILAIYSGRLHNPPILEYYGGYLQGKESQFQYLLLWRIPSYSTVWLFHQKYIDLETLSVGSFFNSLHGSLGFLNIICNWHWKLPPSLSLKYLSLCKIHCFLIWFSPGNILFVNWKNNGKYRNEWVVRPETDPGYFSAPASESFTQQECSTWV